MAISKHFPEQPYLLSQGQLENTETREREREGTPKTEVNIFDRAAHNKAIVF